MTMTSWPRIATGKRYEIRASGEVRIYEGFGRVEDLSLKTGQRNGHVTIKADHLQRPVKGWCESTSPIWPIVEAAHKSGGRIAYQVILERKRPRQGEPPIDPSIPIEALDHQAQTTSKVEFVYLVDGAGVPIDTPPSGWTPESAGLPSSPAPAAVPPAAPPPRAEAPAQPEPPARLPGSAFILQPESGPPLCPLCGKTTINAGAILKHRPTGRFAHVNPCLETARNPSSGAAQGPPPEQTRAGGPRLAEAKPWERTIPNTDTLNLGSYAIKASTDMVVLATRLLREYRTAAGKTLPVPADHVKHLAWRLLMAADRCQELVRPDGHHDRNDFSHNRCRDAVRVSLEDFPVPFDGPAETLPSTRDQWVHDLATYAAELVKVAIELDR